MSEKTNDAALDNYYNCEKCGENFKDCECEEYAWITDIAVDSTRRCIAAHGYHHYYSSFVSDRACVAEWLGFQKAADEIMAQYRLYGQPGPPAPEPTEAEIAEARANLAELEANGECGPGGWPTQTEIAEAKASEAHAHEVLAKSQFGDCRWSDKTWAYIDVLLGADKKSIIKADAQRNAAEKPWIMRSRLVNGKWVTETYEEFIRDSVKFR
jgi:hypothetical protein